MKVKLYFIFSEFWLYLIWLYSNTIVWFVLSVKLKENRGDWICLSYMLKIEYTRSKIWNMESLYQSNTRELKWKDFQHHSVCFRIICVLIKCNKPCHKNKHKFPDYRNMKYILHNVIAKKPQKGCLQHINVQTSP